MSARGAFVFGVLVGGGAATILLVLMVLAVFAAFVVLVMLALFSIPTYDVQTVSAPAGEWLSCCAKWLSCWLSCSSEWLSWSMSGSGDWLPRSAV